MLTRCDAAGTLSELQCVTLRYNQISICPTNAGLYKSAVAWLEQKYEIKGIKISLYNSKANERIERPHWDLCQMLYKATGKNSSK